MITDELGGQANVAILDYPDVANVVIRANAIRAAIEAGAPDAVIVGNYLGGTTENGLSSMESALVEHPEINVIVSINDAGALGAMQALENAGKTDAIIVGIDAEAQARALIAEGGMYRGTVDTSPAETGVMSGNAAVKLLAGSEFLQNIAVPTTLITKKRIDSWKRSRGMASHAPTKKPYALTQKTDFCITVFEKTNASVQRTPRRPAAGRRALQFIGRAGFIVIFLIWAINLALHAQFRHRQQPLTVLRQASIIGVVAVGAHYNHPAG